jgi:hypothetical protein
MYLGRHAENNPAKTAIVMDRSGAVRPGLPSEVNSRVAGVDRIASRSSTGLAHHNSSSASVTSSSALPKHPVEIASEAWPPQHAVDQVVKLGCRESSGRHFGCEQYVLVDEYRVEVRDGVGVAVTDLAYRLTVGDDPADHCHRGPEARIAVCSVRAERGTDDRGSP